MSDERAPNPMDQLSATQLLERRILLLDGELDDAGGTRLCSQLFLLSAADPEADISLWINSPGGSVPAMLAIMDTMRLIPNTVSTLALGIACSAGQFLLTSGTPGYRYALPHAKILMHQGSAGIGGSAVDIELQADDLRLTRDTVLALMAQMTGQTVERIFEDSLRDRWYTAEAAKAYGFIDDVLHDLDEVRPRPRTRIGLSAMAGTR
ncbi:ATP-dependent Clp protease proteolytic subunit [Luteipulveratus sp. YIM 133132]|uniref:ClpP family protease n=1 Tax=Luteipulveratus flavus TaxID=3031728 RepID=UPI0023B12862|nr:ATP-dependent Clp protease proteolytic subunit [Luteipulveratus sp. YIM 133132]MDE9365159.1 ATP-dependent Clp protease proteolytic subunit [Luteipulveratus sp. YIM 133132]